MNSSSKIGHKGLPILRGRVIGTLIYVHCPYCDDEHTHGWEPGETKPTMRCAHCHDQRSPFDQSGYYIAPFRKTVDYNATNSVPARKAELRAKQDEDWVKWRSSNENINHAS